MLAVRRGPATGAFAQLVLLAILAATTGLDAVSWLAGVLYALVTCVTLSHGMNRTGKRAFGPADWVTQSRAVLVGGVAALTAGSLAHPAPLRLVVGLVVVALLLDGVDGQVARRTGTCSPLGARFDMEVDAFLLLVLSVYVTRFAGGWWTLAIGGMRYAFVAAMWVLPWMRATLPPRYWRKVVAATQGVALVAATADVLPRALTAAVLVVALALLVESFGRDVLWLWHRRPLRARRLRPAAHRAVAVRPLPATLVTVGGDDTYQRRARHREPAVSAGRR